MMSIKLITAFVLSLLTSTAFGKFYIPWLRKKKNGQEIKDELKDMHGSKAGTPTMGGFIFIVGALVAVLTVGFEGMLKGNFQHIFVFLFALVYGAIGFLDDWEKVSSRKNLGLTAKAKFALQFIAAIGFILLMIKLGYISHNMYIPFVNKEVFVPLWLYCLLAAFVITGTVNAVNITDGLDGLAGGTSLPVFLFFVAVSCLAGEKYLELGVFASGMLGGLIGFLVYNFVPAKVFMGDTGSLFLGGAIVAMAFAYDMPLILITLGIIFIIETLSDIIQVTYFKLTHGKRVFKMAPFHHHLEKGGWSGRKWTEKEIVLTFTFVSAVFAVISFIGVYSRFV